MKPINSVLLSFALASCVAAAAPAAADDSTTGTASAVYCVEKGPVVVEGTTVYPGGRYCVPGP